MTLLTVGAVFGVFSHCLSRFCNSFCYVEKMVRSECLALVKYNYLIHTIIFIRLLRLSGISKICVSFADKYMNKPRIFPKSLK